MAHDIYESIEASWKQELLAQGRLDRRHRPELPGGQSAREFYHALITELTIPDLDASSKDAAHLT